MIGAKESSLSHSREELRASWKRHIEAAEESPLSIRDYCLEHGLSSTNYYYWRRRLKGRKAKESVDFVRVAVSSEAVPACVVRLELGGGVFLSFDREPSVDWVLSLVRSLGGKGR